MAIAALQGATGVTLAAASAHLTESANLTTASQFLLFHASAGLALAALASLYGRSRWLLTAALALQTGVTLFALDLSLRVFGVGKLFPYAAPIGGSLTILSWLTLAAWAVAEFVAPSRSAPQKDCVAPKN